MADTIVTINGKYSYHIEAQFEKDNDIVFRVFSYGHGHAHTNRESGESGYVLKFPEPKIIYLYAGESVADKYNLISLVQAVKVLQIRGII